MHTHFSVAFFTVTFHYICVFYVDTVNQYGFSTDDILYQIIIIVVLI